MLKQSILRLITIAAIGSMLLTSNIGWTQDAKFVIGGNATAKDTVKAAVIYSTTSGVKFPNGSVQTSASGITIGTGTSIVNNLGGGNSSAAALSIIASGKNDSIYGNADYGIILGGKNNVIENNSSTVFSSSFPAPVNPGSHNFISSGEFNRIKPNANHAAIIGGRNNTVATGAANSIILGGSGITATEPNTVYMQKAAVTDLAMPGSGLRMVMVDSNGALNTAAYARDFNNPCIALQSFGTFWGTSGTFVPGNCSAFIGTTDNADFITKTNSIEQMRVTASGNIGIGTINPTSKLVIYGIDATPSHSALNVTNNSGISLLAVRNDGNIGIGTTGPNAKLDISGDIAISGSRLHVDAITGQIGIGTATPQAQLDVNTVGGNFKFDGSGSAGYTTTFGMDNTGLKIGHNTTIRDIEFSIAGTTWMIVDGNTSSGHILGNVGIGTCKPQNKLEVAGTIRSFEWIVENFPTCDFVFEDNYNRMNYVEKEKYLKANKHLKGIASAQETDKNGLKAGEAISGVIMNVEENSLDIIDLYKIIEQQKKKIEELEKKIDEKK